MNICYLKFYSVNFCISLLKCIPNYFDRTTQKNPDNIEGLIVTEKVEEKMPREIFKIKYIDKFLVQLKISNNMALHHI